MTSLIQQWQQRILLRDGLVSFLTCPLYTILRVSCKKSTTRFILDLSILLPLFNCWQTTHIHDVFTTPSLEIPAAKSKPGKAASSFFFCLKKVWSRWYGRSVQQIFTFLPFSLGLSFVVPASNNSLQTKTTVSIKTLLQLFPRSS